MTERDSAGVRIVENRGPPPRANSWAISSEPELVIGVPAGERSDQLWDVAAVSSLSDGRIVVANRGTLELRLYSPTGEFLLSFGGEGEGPGEFSYMEMAGILPGDTVVFSDLDLRRLSLFHPDIGFVRSSPISNAVDRWNWTLGLMGRRVMRGGIERFELSTHPAGRKGLERILTSFQTITLDGALETDLGTFPFRDIYHDLGNIKGHQTEVAYEVPFGVEASFAVAGDRFFFGSGDSYEISVFDSEAQLLSIVRWDRKRVSVLAEDVEGLLRQRESAAESEQEALEVRQEFAKVPAGTRFPAFDGFEVDILGNLWVGEFPRPAENGKTYHIFDPKGHLVGELAVPKECEIVMIGIDYVFALVRDEMEVEYLHKYRLRRP